MTDVARPAIDGLRALYPAPAWALGSTPPGDAEFLLAMVTQQAPVTVVELGVAAGVSSAVLLYSLDTLPEIAGGRVLHSCDVQPSCYFDAERATGGATATMYPRPRAAWNLDTNTDARRLASKLPPASVDLTFIDANHFHPWPLLDLLHMTAVAKPGSWVILHDTNLPIVNPACQASGAKWLFDEWPFEKRLGGEPRHNIGAVKLPEEFAHLVPFASELVERSWEFAPTLWHVGLPTWFHEVQELVERQITRVA